MVLRAQDIMDTSILTVDSESDALSCAQSMVERRKGYAILTQGATKKVTGIVTEWDYLRRIVAAGVDPSRTPVREIASAIVHAVPPETPTDEVVAKMADLGIRRMVVQKGEEVVGVITSRNVLATFRQYVDRLSSEIAGYQSNQTPLG
jgi:signal-transduction protein with cAMP-binding, CBS, and nucleotidyltransferase domain